MRVGIRITQYVKEYELNQAVSSLGAEVHRRGLLPPPIHRQGTPFDYRFILEANTQNELDAALVWLETKYKFNYFNI